MPLVAADDELAIRREGSQAARRVLGRRAHHGPAVDEIVDIVDDRLDIELVADRSDLVGSAVIRGRATEVVERRALPAARA